MNIITDTAKMKCTVGTIETSLVVTSQMHDSVNGKLQATEEDKQANVNILPFGQCRLKPTTGGYLPCVPCPIKWENTAKNTTINEKKILTDESTCNCAIGGKISVTDRGHNENHKVE